MGGRCTCVFSCSHKMKVLLICLLLFVSQIAANEKWEAYKVTHLTLLLNYLNLIINYVQRKHGKKYNEQQDAIRRAHFEKTDALIEVHNVNFQRSLVTYKMEHNLFSDMVRP